MITFERVYRGKITSIRQLTTDTLGYRGYEVMFSGKKLYFECHIKSQLPMSVGQTIRFYGNWMGKDGKQYFQIKEILDDKKNEMLESQNLSEILSQEN